MVCTWDLNLWQQYGRRSQNNGAMSAAQLQISADCSVNIGALVVVVVVKWSACSPYTPTIKFESR